MADERMTRVPRENDTRTDEAREQFWTPSRLLPDPKANPDLDYRYVRVSTRDGADNLNLSQALRDGWEPVRSTDQPEMKIISDKGAREIFPDGILVGGLLLCQRPKRIGEQILSYAENESNRRARSIEETYMSEDDRRMKKFAERTSRVAKFG